jgi:hypothetical protein
VRIEHPETVTYTLSRACPGHPRLHLTNDLHGCRQFGSHHSLALGLHEIAFLLTELRGSVLPPSPLYVRTGYSSTLGDISRVKGTSGFRAPYELDMGSIR